MKKIVMILCGLAAIATGIYFILREIERRRILSQIMEKAKNTDHLDLPIYQLKKGFESMSLEELKVIQTVINWGENEDTQTPENQATLKKLRDIMNKYRDKRKRP